MIVLSRRLKEITSLVDPEAILVDVGADHGKLLIYLRQHRIIAKGYGVENKMGPYLVLSNNLVKSQFTNLHAIYQNGIASLPEDADTLVLAGLGGEAIIGILDAGREHLKQIKVIIVDAHRSLERVRRFVVNIGYRITEEKIIKERGIYYSLVKFHQTPSKVTYSDFEYRYGPIIIKDPLFKSYAHEQITKMDDLLKSNLPEEIRNRTFKEREALKPYEN